MKFLDPNDPFFRRAWVRWATTLVPLGWGVAELAVFGAPIWGALFIAAGLYAGWMLFFNRSGP